MIRVPLCKLLRPAALCMLLLAPGLAAADPTPLWLDLSLVVPGEGEPLVLKVDGAPRGLVVPGEGTLVPLDPAPDAHQLRLETPDGSHSAALQALAGPRGVKLSGLVAESCMAAPVLKALGAAEGRWRWQVSLSLQRTCERVGRGSRRDPGVSLRVTSTPEAQVYHEQRSAWPFRTSQYQALGKTPKSVVVEPVTTAQAWNVVIFRAPGHLDCVKRYQIVTDNKLGSMVKVENGDVQPIVKVPSEDRDLPVVSCTLTTQLQRSAGAR